MMDTSSPPEVLGVPPRPQKPKKRSRSEHKAAPNTDIAKLRDQISAHKKKCQGEIRDIYRENLAELFFLQHGLNLIDFPQWRKKPNQLLASYLQNYALEEEEPVSRSTVKDEPTAQTPPPAITHPPPSQSVAEKLARTATVSECSHVSDTPNKTEAIVEQAKKEAEVIQRYGELRKQGLWSQRRLPKVQEPLRPKAHWDYLIEEMQWLAADFAQERKWKRAGCKKISKMVMKYHQERLEDERRAEKEESFRLKRIAGQLAKQIKDFWSNVEKVVQYKMDSRLDEKRRQVMDTHLNFIVGQTEKYSSWLTEGLTQPGTITESPTISRTSSTAQLHRDGEFEPSSDSADDEETIAREEHHDQGDTNEELLALQAESEMPLEELLKSLPSEVLENPVDINNQSETDESSSHAPSNTSQSDREFNKCASESDDELTLAEQEQVEDTQDGDNDTQMELDELRAENEMSVEDLAAKYAGAYASDFELPDTPSSSEAEDGNITSDDSDSESDQSNIEQDNDQTNTIGVREEVGLDYLLHPEKDEDEMTLSDSEGPGKGIRDIAAAAQSFQPTGYTLETTSVKTPVPFLLKHTLREYQHVGLDWLATMYDKKLNGILADEMGLGKTIQTIAVLAHLACQHEVWGPHLIVVPTSVMLNWEMELKKWCPAFKILTYYGSPKERKLKRVGWTKTNAFHICITSYKLVIQDHIAFRRKKWKYLILDEAQNIKNFKSQRWQTLLNFSSQRRLLLTGTPLQNNLMELWSLMHFLMPNVFQSHFDFKEWFSNPLTGMIEGNTEYNEQLIRRLHKVLRPFLLRRLKADVEKQLPKKYEHVIMCKLSKRQRLLYDEFMSRKITKETLESGNFMSVINILMQLRKVCNHPDMFDPRPITSPFETENISIETANAVLRALDYHPLQRIDPTSLYPSLASLELQSSAYSAHRSRQLQTPSSLIEVIGTDDDSMCRPPPTKLRPFVIRSSAPAANVQPRPLSKLPPKTVSITSSVLKPGSPASSQSNTNNNTATSAAIKQAVLNPKLTSLALKQGGVLHLIQTSTGQTLITSAANVQALSSSLPNSRVIPVTTVMVSSSANATLASVLTQAKSSSITTGAGSATTSLAGVDPVTGRPVLRVLPQQVTAVNNSQTITTSTAQTSGALMSDGLVNGSKPAVISSPVATTSNTAATRTPSLIGPASRKRAREQEAKTKYEAELKLDVLTSREENWRKNTLERIVKLNKNHCTQRPVYGSDLHEAVDVWKRGFHSTTSGFSNNSCINCRNASLLGEIASTPYIYNHTTNTLKHLIKSYDERLLSMSDILERFVFYTPPVKSSAGSRCSSGNILLSTREHDLIRDASFKLHPIQTRMLVQFPERRLIQYDCGKLQTLDLLLRELKPGLHRVLIFTQMTKMLDILEAFLSFHGHRYLRLDGTTGVEKRQILMDRFNADKRIFVFILSTRSGGIGVNLTGADTVIFYDSDWNPTMDAQAQDRCHRIGQTRDVHIYRLISEKTIEENILKKANQKRLLGDVAIEGGNFTTAKLQKNTISDLFAEPSGLDQLVKQQQQSTTTKSAVDDESQIELPPTRTKQLEQALGAAEDAEDVAATHMAQDEVSAELAEFDENIPWDERDGELRQKQAESSNKVEREIAMIEKELSTVERYAVKFLESTDEQFSEQAVKEAEDEIEEAKRDWELNRLKDQRQEEERIAENEEDEMLFTYSTEDHVNKVFKDAITGENMPMWCPPTPPRENTDVYYTDHSLGFLYDSAVMSESSLPPIFIKKERKRKHVDYQMHSIKPKKRLMEEVDGPPPITTHISSSHRPPRSLFDRPSNKFKRDKQAALHKHSSLPSAYAAKLSAAGLVSGKPHIPEPSAPDAPEWLIHEDWSLLQAVQQILQLPLTLSNQSPAHTPNWDLVSETVSTVSRIYRSPKQCKYRYESYIIPKEEGKLIYDPNPARTKNTSKKQQKLLQKTKMKPMKVGQQYANDGGSSVTTLHAFRFDCIKNVASKRAPSMRPTLVNPLMRNPRHAAVLQENGIQYDQPMTPEEIAKARQERINDEKKRAKEQQLAQQRAVIQQATQRAASSQQATQQQILQQIPVSATAQAHILVSKDSIVVSRASLVSAIANQHSTMSAATKSALVSAAAGVSSITRTLPGSIVVSNNASNFSAINKRLNAGNTTSIVGLSQVTQQTGASNTTNIATTRRLSMQDIQRSQYNPTQLVRQMQSGNQSLTSASAVIGSPRTITVQQQPTHLAAITGNGKSLNLLRHQVAQGRAGNTIVQRPVGITQAGIRTTTSMAKGAGTITSLPIQSAKSGTTSSELQQQLLKQKIQVSLTHQQLATTVAAASGQTQATLVKTVNTSGTAPAPNVTIPVSGAVNINVSIAQQAKAGLQGATKATLTNQPTQLRQIQLLKQGTAQSIARPQQKIGLTTHHLMGKGGQASVQIVQTADNKQLAQKLRGSIQQACSKLFKPQGTQIQQIITAPTGALTGSNTLVTSTASQITPGQTIIATTQLITPPNMQATITKMSTGQNSLNMGNVSNVTVSLARPAVTSTSAVTIVPTSSVTQASLVNQSPMKSQTLTGGRIPTNLTQRQHVATIGPSAGGAHTSASSIVTLTQPSVSASLMGKTIIGGTLQSLTQQHKPTATPTITPPTHSTTHTTHPQHSSMDVTEVPASSITIVSQTKPPQRTQLVESLITNRMVSETLSRTVSETRQSVSDSISRPSIERAVSETISRASAEHESLITPTSQQPTQQHTQQPTTSAQQLTVTTVPAPSPAVATTVTTTPGVPGQTSQTPDGTRTYAMRPRKQI